MSDTDGYPGLRTSKHDTDQGLKYLTTVEYIWWNNAVKEVFDTIRRDEQLYYMLNLNRLGFSCIKPNEAVKKIGYSVYDHLDNNSAETIQYLNTVKDIVVAGKKYSDSQGAKIKKLKELNDKHNFNLENIKAEIHKAIEDITDNETNNKCYKKTEVIQHVKRIYDAIIDSGKKHSEITDKETGKTYSILADDKSPARPHLERDERKVSEDGDGNITVDGGGRRRRRRTASKRRSGKRRVTRKRSTKRRGGKKSVSKAGKRKTIKRKQ